MPYPSVALPAVRLHAAVAGSGPTVVCLHSSASASSQWRRLIESEQGRYRFVAFDFHGHGRSPAHTGGHYALRTESDAVWNAIAAIGGPIHLVGHSYGGAVALDLATRHAGRFASVCVYEPVLFGLLDAGSAEYREITTVGMAIARHAYDGRLEDASAGFIDYWSGPGTWARMPVEQQERVRGRIVAVAAHFDALFAGPLPFDRLRGLQTPTLLLHGDRSPVPARTVSARLATLPSVTTDALPGLGHMGPVTHAAIVNERIAAYLGRHATDAVAA